MNRKLPLVLVACATAIVLACGSTASTPPPPASGAPKPPPKVAASASASASASAISFNEADFTESDSSRDPFHAFSAVVRPAGEAKIVPQYEVVLEKYRIDELKLVAIVKAGDMKAMFVDPTGKGWTVSRGTHLGRGEVVKIGPGAMSSYPLYWKVDKIKDTEVVLVREDTLHPEVQPTYREIPLHVEGEKS